jgi:hypothetical protein
MASPSGCGTRQLREGQHEQAGGGVGRLQHHRPHSDDFRKRGGRKMVVTPEGAPWAPRPRVDNAMVKALARAFRWRRMLDEGICGTMDELAKREGVNRGYMSRVLRLTLLAPEIVEAILDGRQPAELQLDDLLVGFPLEWDQQRERSRGGKQGRYFD